MMLPLSWENRKSQLNIRQNNEEVEWPKDIKGFVNGGFFVSN